MGEIADILVSCDGSWQKRGFTSLYGVVFVIAHETGKVVDFHVMSKECQGCRLWEGMEQTPEYVIWKRNHQCEKNYEGSSGGMEPHGMSILFNRSLPEKIRYKYLISDGDSKSHALILEQQPYGSSCIVEKKDCIGHVHKRMGSALLELKQRMRGRKLDDGKTIGGKGRLTKDAIESLQNYYGKAIRDNVGDVNAMMKAVQATLLHKNSTDEAPRHHLCDPSWCKYLQARERKEEFHHKDSIPDAIVKELRPIYKRLGARSLLEKCKDGYTQNANESIHALVWKYCPKVMHMGRSAVSAAVALAVCSWNDGLASIQGIAEYLDIPMTPHSVAHLVDRSVKRIKKARYRAKSRTMVLRSKAKRRRKGLNKAQKKKEGVMYAPGAFGADQPGPSGCGGSDDDQQSSQAELSGKGKKRPIDDSDADSFDDSDDQLWSSSCDDQAGAGVGRVWKGKGTPRKQPRQV